MHGKSIVFFNLWIEGRYASLSEAHWDERLAPRVRQLKIGDGLDEASEMGPLVTAAHWTKVKGYVDHGELEGARLLVDGRGLKVPGRESGFFLGGCLFDHVQPGMRIYDEEIFGPVLSVVRVPDFAAAVDLVHDLLDRFGGKIHNEKQKVQAGRIAAFGVGAIAILLGIAFQGINVSFLSSATEPAHKYLDYFHRVYQLILTEYVDEASPKDMFYGAIRGMINSLNDPFSRFLDEKSFEELKEMTTGKFQGGMTMVTLPLALAWQARRMKGCSSSGWL